MKKRSSLKQILVSLSNLSCVKHADRNKIQESNTEKSEIKKESACHEDDSVSEVKALVGRRIKVVMTRKQLDRLLAKQISFEQLVFMNQKASLRYLDDSKWIPRLESIDE